MIRCTYGSQLSHLVVSNSSYTAQQSKDSKGHADPLTKDAPISKCASLSLFQSATSKPNQPADHQALRSSVDPVSDACYQKLGIEEKSFKWLLTVYQD